MTGRLLTVASVFALTTFPSAAAWAGSQDVDPSVVVSPSEGPPGSPVEVHAVCGEPAFDFRLSVQFRSAAERPRAPFDLPDGTPADPRLPQEQLPSPGGEAIVAVRVPTEAAAGASFFDVLCLNAEGGGIPGGYFSVAFTVTDLPATGPTNLPFISVAAAFVIVGILATRLARRPT